MKSWRSYNIVCEIVQMLYYRKVIQCTPEHQWQIYILIAAISKMCGSSYICNIRRDWDLMITRWQTRKIFRLCSKWNTRLDRGLNLLSPFHTGPNHVIWKNIVKLVLWIIDHLINTSNNLKRGNTHVFVICVNGEIAVCMYILPWACFVRRSLNVNWAV